MSKLFIYCNYSILFNDLLYWEPLPSCCRPKIVSSNTSAEPKVIRANISAVIDIDRFGNLKKLLRVTAYVLRFVKELKKAKQHDKGSRDLKFLSASEIEQAEIM